MRQGGRLWGGEVDERGELESRVGEGEIGVGEWRMSKQGIVK